MSEELTVEPKTCVPDSRHRRSSVITENDTGPREECSAKRLLGRLAGNLFRYRSFSLFFEGCDGARADDDNNRTP